MVQTQTRSRRGRKTRLRLFHFELEALDSTGRGLKLSPYKHRVRLII